MRQGLFLHFILLSLERGSEIRPDYLLQFQAYVDAWINIGSPNRDVHLQGRVLEKRRL